MGNVIRVVAEPTGKDRSSETGNFPHVPPNERLAAGRLADRIRMSLEAVLRLKEDNPGVYGGLLEQHNIR